MAVKQGWDDLGNGLVQNKNVYGGVVDVNNPIYTNAPDTPAPQQGVEAGGGVQAAPAPITDVKQVQNTTTNVGQTIAQGAPTTIAQSFQQALVNKLNPATVSADDPTIKASVDANRLAEQRGLENNRALVAERAASQGLDQNAFNSALMGLAAQSAGRESAFEGNAFQHATDTQNQDAMTALGQVGNLLSGNANRDVQQQLGQGSLDNQKYGIDTQAALGHEGNQNQLTLGTGGLNLGLLQALLGNDQFGKGLSQQGTQFGQTLDQNGLLGLLGLL